MAGKNWLDAVLGLGPEWKVTGVDDPSGDSVAQSLDLL